MAGFWVVSHPTLLHRKSKCRPLSSTISDCRINKINSLSGGFG